MKSVASHFVLRTCRSYFLLGAVFSLPCFAGETSYISEVKSINELYQVCLDTVSKTHNIHCINGRDETINVQAETSSPYDVFWKAANKNEIERNNEEDLTTLYKMKVGGDAPSSGNKVHFAFVHIYRAFYAYSRVPVVKATASLYTVEPGRSGVGYHASKPIKAWFTNALKALPMVAVSSEDGRAVSAKYQAMVDATFQQERESVKQAADKTKPNCTEIKFTGIAAIYPEDLATVNRSKDKADLLAAHPLVCNTVSGGRNYNGAILNPYSRTTCKGISYFQNQRAIIQSWTANAYYIGTNVDLNTGRTPLAMWINRTSATCSK